MTAERDIISPVVDASLEGRATRWGLVIGIDSYQDQRLNLRCAAADARAIHALMVDPSCGGFAVDNVQLLLDESATTQGIRKALSRLSREASTDDVVWVYYAGHAAIQVDVPYWITHDSDVDDLLGTALDRNWIMTLVGGLRAKVIFLMLDCCHAAAMALRRHQLRAVMTPEDLYGGFKGHGTIILAASDGKEKSVELTEHGHGAFTYYLDLGLRGDADLNGDGVVTADELWQYLHSKVRDASGRVGNPQTPVLIGELRHDVMLTRARPTGTIESRQPSPPRSPRSPRPAVRLVGLVEILAGGSAVVLTLNLLINRPVEPRARVADAEASLVSSQKGAARDEMATLGLAYNADSFLRSAEEGDLRALKLYLAAGIDPNLSGDEGLTALMFAARNNDILMATALLAAHANPNLRTGDGSSALSCAVSFGKLEMMRFLLANGSDAETIDGAFFQAARRRNRDALAALASRGAHIDRVGTPALLAAIESSADDDEAKAITRLLLDLGAKAGGSEADGWTAMFQAAMVGRPSVIEELVKSGAAVNVQCRCPGVFDGGWTPLLIAIKTRHGEAVDMLLANGADVNLRSANGHTALVLAGHQVDPRIFMAVLTRDPDVNARSVAGRTALMEVSAGVVWPDMIVDAPDAVRALLQRGARVNDKDDEGSTALMLAAQSGSSAVVQALLTKGARVSDKDAHGRTALDRARESTNRGRASVIRLLAAR